MAVALTACAASGPAPVEHRTRAPAGAPIASARPAPAPSAPAASPVAPAADAVVVQAQPVPSSGVQVRPLAPPEPATPAVTAPLRTQPQGLKRPYSDAALAELKALDPADARPAAPEPAARQEAKPDTKETRPDPRAAGAGAFAWPARGRLIQSFVETRSTGIGIAGTPGDPVQAAADGRVIFAGPGPRGYGNLLIVRHDADTLSVYAHNRALLVKDGAQVKRGQQIAELGESGTDRPKLHFEIRRGGKPVDPLTLLPAR